jgi:hypothetical protein
MTSPRCHQVLSKSQFLRYVEEILELDPLSLQGPEWLSGSKEWDSAAIIDFMAMADKYTGVILSVDAIASCATYDDLYALIES